MTRPKHAAQEHPPLQAGLLELARLLARQAVREHFTSGSETPSAPTAERSKRVLPTPATVR